MERSVLFRADCFGNSTAFQRLSSDPSPSRPRAMRPHGAMWKLTCYEGFAIARDDRAELTSVQAPATLPEAMSLSTPRSRRKPRASTTRRVARASVKLPAGERYTALRKAEFLLNNAATETEYKV